MKITTFFGLVFLLANSFVQSQTVQTFTAGTPDDSITIDNAGNIYASNYTGDTVFKYTPTGDMTPFITGLNTPNGLAFNSNQELYVCDGAGNTIYKYDIDGNLLATYPNTGHPSGIVKAYDSETMIFTEYIGNTINTLAPDGTITEISSNVGLVGPVGLVYGDDDTLYLGNYNDRKIYKVLADGSLDYIATIENSSSLGFIAYAQGMLWTTVFGTHKIYKINPNGVDDYEVFAGSVAGGTDGDISQATFNQPNGIAFNDTGDVMYVTDFGSKNLRVISGITLGVSEIANNSGNLNLYVNSSRDTLTVDTSLKNSSYHIKVYDMSGKVVFQKNETTTDRELKEMIEIGSWTAGIYLVEVSNKAQSITKKFVK